MNDYHITTLIFNFIPDMHPKWQEFLQQEQPSFSDNEIDLVLNHATISTLTQKCLIEVSGDDAETFLQGQLSNDIKLVNSTQSQLSTYCTPKGRMLAIFRIFLFDDKYYLETNIDLKESIIKRLSMFVIMSKVEIKDASDKLVNISINSLFYNMLNDIPNKLNEVKSFKDYLVIKTDKRLQFIGKIEKIKTIWLDLLSKEFKPVHANAWHITDLKNGIPSIYPESSEAFIPQMANLDKLGAINYKKGCYTGQEVIARLHYRGKQKREMVLASVKSKTPPKIGAAVFRKDEKSKQGSGNIVDFATLEDNHFLLLCILQSEQLKDETFLDKEQQNKIKLES